MKRNKKGISLITLVIIIIIMIILAAAIILSLTQSGIFDKANEATSKYNLQQVQKIAELAWAEAYADGERDVTKLQEAVDEALEDNELDDKYEAIADEKGVTVKEKEQDGGSSAAVAEYANKCVDKNTVVYDEFGNKIVIPAGFKIRVDSDAGEKGDEKTTAINVTQGIVIEDCTETSTNGSQFVWVPVGKIYTTSDEATKEATAKTIPLGRYDYNENVNNYVPDENGEYMPATRITRTNYVFDNETGGYIDVTIEYIEETATENGLGQYGNAIARNIVDFVTSANKNYGYYIGRFEAGNASNTLVCKTGQTVYVNKTQPESSVLCKNMYNNGKDGYNTDTFSSDLTNSYAWDTAIIFIQAFGENVASNYYNQNNCIMFRLTGENKDEYCNINDMSGNSYEWSTETYSSNSIPCVCRGGQSDAFNEMHYYNTSYRFSTSTSDCGNDYGTKNYSFRPILYVAVTE